MSNTPNYQLVDINELEAKLAEMATQLRAIKGIDDGEKWSWQDNYVDNVKGIFSNVKHSDLGRGIEHYTLDRMGVPLDGENEYIMLAIGEFANWSKMKTFTIPEKKKVMVLDIGTFYNCSSLQEAIFPDAVYCGMAVFSGCEELQTISLPNWDGIQTYGELFNPIQCFYNCKKLVNFDAPLEQLWESEFEGCESLMEVNFDKVREAAKAAFKDCKGLTKVSLPLVTSFKESLFEGCEALTEVNISGNPYYMSERTFKNCTSLTDFSSTIYEFREEAFFGCSNLKNITISVRGNLGVGVGAFEGCKYLIFNTPNGEVVFNYIDDRGLKGCEQINFIQMSNSSNTIGAQACMDCINLTGFNGPSAYGARAEAFKNCKNLKTVQIGGGSLAGGADLGENAFENCNKIQTYLTPYYNIDSYVYSHHDNIDNLSIGNLVLDNNFFEGWNSLIDIKLPVATTLSDYTFKDCTKLMTAYLPMVSNFGVGLFENCSNLKILDFGSLTTFNGFPDIDNLSLNSFSCGYNGELYESILEKIKNISTISLTAITTIPEQAFLENTVLFNFSAPLVTAVGTEAFKGCSNLTELNLTGVTSLGDNVFENCEKLKILRIPEISSITALGNNDLSNFTSLTLGLVEYPANFLNNAAVEFVSLNVTPTTIGAEAFANNESLNSVVLTGTSYGSAESMFANCTNLTSVRISGTQKATLDPTMFDGTPIMKEIGGGTIYVYSAKLSQYQSSYPNWNFAAG